MIIPLSTFRVPDGRLAITAHLHGMKRPASIIIEPSSIERLLAEVEQTLELNQASRSDRRVHAQLRDVVRRALLIVNETNDAGHGIEAIEGTMWSLLWLILNHPQQGDQLRGAVGSALRRTKKASITVQSDERGAWGFAVSDGILPLKDALALMPRSVRPISIAIKPRSIEAGPLE